MHITGEERAIGESRLQKDREKADEHKRQQNKAKRNRRAIHDYITIIRGTVDPKTGGVINLEEIQASSNKPDSEPPLNDRAMRLLLHSDNRHAARHIEPAMDWLATHNGIAHYAVRVAINEPTLPAKWENKDTEEDEARLYAYNNALKLMERHIREVAPDTELNVAYDPEDEPAANRIQARENARRYGVEEAYEDLAKLVYKRMELGDSKTTAVEAVAYNNDTWPSKVWRALANQQDEAV